MTDSKPVASTADLGVVEPLRIPGAAAVRRAWAGLPRLAQLFVALAAADVVVRLLGLFRTELGFYLEYPLSWFTAFFPHDALILLPALVVARRPDAIASTPLVLRGAVLISLVELLGQPARAVVSGNPFDPIIAPTVVSILGILLTAGGWWWIAQGLKAVDPLDAPESVAGLANLVGGGIALAAIVNLAIVLIGPAPELGDETWTRLLQLNSAMFAVQSLALAYLARTVVRGMGDSGRPLAATYLAGAALVLYAVGSVLMLGVGQGALWTVIGWVTGPVALTVFLVAFRLGLADPWGTIEAAVHSDQPFLS